MSMILIKKDKSSWIKLKLSEFKFKEADELFYELINSNNYNQEVIGRYEEIRKTYVEKFFSEKIALPHKFDQEQLSAISSIYKNTLVSARAGS